MKNITIIAILTSILMPQVLFAQIEDEEIYTVVSIKGGKVKIVDEPRFLERGDQILQNDILNFIPSTTKMMVYHPEKGLQTLSAKKPLNEEIRAGELEYWVEENLSPLSSPSEIRNNIVINNELDLQEHFNKGKYFVFGGSIKLVVNPQYLPMNEDRYFFVKFVHEESPVHKALPYFQDTLLLARDSLFHLEESIIQPEKTKDFEIYYYNAAEKDSTLLSEFFPIFLSDEELEEEIGFLIQELKKRGQNREEVADNVIAYFNEMYEARPVRPDLIEWLAYRYQID